MKPTDSYVYYEDNLDNPLHGWKRNNDNLMWRYWAAKEMAESAYWDVREVDGNYYCGNYYFSHDKFINILSQILKKEWFR